MVREDNRGLLEKYETHFFDIDIIYTENQLRACSDIKILGISFFINWLLHTFSERKP